MPSACERVSHGQPQHMVVSADAPSTLIIVVRGSAPKLQPSRNDPHTQCPHEWIRNTTLKFLRELPSQKFRNQPPQRTSSGDAPTPPSVWPGCQSRAHEGFCDVRKDVNACEANKSTVSISSNNIFKCSQVHPLDPGNLNEQNTARTPCG